MIECLSCEREISERANPCPYCGEPNAGERSVAKQQSIRDYITSPEYLERMRKIKNEGCLTLIMIYLGCLIVSIGVCLLIGMPQSYAIGVGSVIGLFIAPKLA